MTRYIIEIVDENNNLYSRYATDSYTRAIKDFTYYWGCMGYTIHHSKDIVIATKGDRSYTISFSN